MELARYYINTPKLGKQEVVLYDGKYISFEKTSLWLTVKKAIAMIYYYFRQNKVSDKEFVHFYKEFANKTFTNYNKEIEESGHLLPMIDVNEIQGIKTVKEEKIYYSM